MPSFVALYWKSDQMPYSWTATRWLERPWINSDMAVVSMWRINWLCHHHVGAPSRKLSDLKKACACIARRAGGRVGSGSHDGRRLNRRKNGADSSKCRCKSLDLSCHKSYASALEGRPQSKLRGCHRPMLCCGREVGWGNLTCAASRTEGRLLGSQSLQRVLEFYESVFSQIKILVEFGFNFIDTLVIFISPAT